VTIGSLSSFPPLLSFPRQFCLPVYTLFHARGMFADTRRCLRALNIYIQRINGPESRLNSCAGKICFVCKMDFDLCNAF